MRSILIIAVLALTLASPYVRAEETLADQARRYNASFGAALNSDAKMQIPGVTKLRTVMPGFVYRGGAGGRQPLSDRALKNLCEAGFSSAIMAYPSTRGFREKSVSCSKGEIQYYAGHGESSKGRERAMEIIENAIRNKKGPLLVHCWYGLHSSGNLAGSALMTFCEKSQSQAASYWLANAL